MPAWSRWHSTSSSATPFSRAGSDIIPVSHNRSRQIAITEGNMLTRPSSTVKTRKLLMLSILLVAALAGALPAHAQEGEPTLTFGLNKIFGYAMGSDIQGTFSLNAHNDEDFTQVVLLIDSQQVHVDDEAPFQIRFSTSDFTPGAHAIQLRGITIEGAEVSSRELVLNFLSSEQARAQTVDFVVPLLAVVLVVMVLSSVLPALLGRGRRAFQPGSYGPAGGAVCSRCELPFGRSLFSANLLVGKLERCPHCGKWGLVRRASSIDLDAAEARFAATHSEGTVQQEDEQEHLRRMVDESRYESND
jgi:hypothetical protein